jgi:hypothetical protein
MAFTVKRRAARDETGTFTPTLAFATAGDSSWAYGTQTGIYTRLGSLVWIHIDLAATPTIGTGSGFVQVGGLPFAAHASHAQALQVSNTDADWNWTAGYTQMYARTGGTVLFLSIMGDAVLAAGVTAAMMATGNEHTIRINGAYRRA